MKLLTEINQSILMKIIGLLDFFFLLHRAKLCTYSSPTDLKKFLFRSIPNAGERLMGWHCGADLPVCIKTCLFEWTPN